ncbi:MAG: sulfotransferase domain-containing protein [Anaerolineales bacterium]|nr:sulfotransferase domain-containing protein [Anaerolineales bacterium]
MKKPIKDTARIVRWRLRRMTDRQADLRVDLPALFANSFPKSGTHLLTQVLAGFTRLGPFIDTRLPAITMFKGRTGAAFSMKTLLRQINRLGPGDIGYGHLHADPLIVEALCRPGMAAYFILRDPRDVVVSHAYYVTGGNAKHSLRGYYNQLESYEERLKISITGLQLGEIYFPDVTDRFEPYLGWFNRPEILTLHFEDFLTRREESLHRVLDHAIARGFAYHGDRDEAVEKLAAVIDPNSSPTFRSGKAGGWQDKFTQEHIDLFKKIAGDLLIRLGYEQDLDW